MVPLNGPPGGPFRVDVDPLVVAGRVGERIDLLLGHLVPLAVAEVLALGRRELVQAGECPHGLPP
jgi:hypothetical protein